MSKRLNNVYTLDDLLAKGWSGREIRYVLLSAHYREQLNFTFDGLQAARSALQRIDEFLSKLQEILGETREYLTIKILHNDMTVNVPTDNAERVGLRKVIDEEAVKKVVKYLTSGGTEMPKNWNRRFKHNRDKMKTGDILELAEVVRNLSLRDHEKGLSTGEKQMFVKAKKILASELMYAKGMDEEQAAEWLEEVLANVGPAKTKSSKAKATAATASV